MGTVRENVSAFYCRWQHDISMKSVFFRLTWYQVVSVAVEEYTVLKYATMLRYVYRVLSILLSRKHAVSPTSCLRYLERTFHHAYIFYDTV